MNRLYWPYIGPTIVNNENKIGVVIESLCIEESDDNRNQDPLNIPFSLSTTRLALV